jgi:hypothetical protein
MLRAKREGWRKGHSAGQAKDEEDCHAVGEHHPPDALSVRWRLAACGFTIRKLIFDEVDPVSIFGVTSLYMLWES